MLVGVSESRWEVLQKLHVHLALSMGLSFKDIVPGDFLGADDDKRPPLPEQQIQNRGGIKLT